MKFFELEVNARNAGAKSLVCDIDRFGFRNGVICVKMDRILFVEYFIEDLSFFRFKTTEELKFNHIMSFVCVRTMD